MFTPLLRREPLWFDYPKTPPPVLAATKSSLFWWLLIGGLTVFKHSGHTPGPGFDISDQGLNSGPMSMLRKRNVVQANNPLTSKFDILVIPKNNLAPLSQ